MNTQNPSTEEQRSIEIINGIAVTNTTGQRGHGGRILPWKGPIPPELKQHRPENTESEEQIQGPRSSNEKM
jgi:hypothetical protein